MRIMRDRILAAVAAGMAMGCQTSSPPVTADVDRVDPDASPIRVDTTKPPPPKSDAKCKEGEHVEAYCLPPRTPVPSMIAPGMREAVVYDKNGCLPPEGIVDGCQGNQSVLSGPRVENGQCCFTVCKTIPAPCGRPFLDAYDRARFAASTRRHDWSAPITVRPSPIADRLREEWLDDAAAEHASIAAFARFTMELLAVGAPPELIERAQRAGVDETNARACYALASAYGPPAGPSSLSMKGIEVREDLAAIAAAAVVEACVGETHAAALAREAHAHCTDPAVAEVLARIAEDEEAHAALGWHFVAWALSRNVAGVRRAIGDAFERALAVDPPRQRADISGLREAGRLTNDDRERTWRLTCEEIITVCRDALLDGTRNSDECVVDPRRLVA